jgi:release factor glutamine methyltransferase
MTDGLDYKTLLATIESQWSGLPDKPEETPRGTLHALWFAAANDPRSVQRSEDRLPSLTEEQQAVLDDLIQKRLSGVPLGHLTGRQSFMGIELLAGPEALIPRVETELLAKVGLSKLKSKAAAAPATVIDVCTGSGNIAIALATHEENCRVHASDLSSEAVSLAQRNLERWGLQERVFLKEGDLFAPFEDPAFYESVDLVTCNPPYISSAKVPKMNEETSRHEPRLAFDGGMLGFDIVSRLIANAPRFLKPGSWLCFEIGLGQGDFLAKRLTRTGAYDEIEPVANEQGDIRVLAARTAA